LSAAAGTLRKKVQPVVDGHVEDVGDVEPLVGDLERLAVEPASAARLAGHVDRRQEIHLDLDHAVALAMLAAAALHVEAEPARPVAAHARGGQLREEIADRVERAGVGERIGARRAPDRRLVDDDGLVDQVEAVDAVVRAGRFLRVVKMAEEGAAKHVVDQRAFARAAHARDAGHQADGKSRP
jgi:hypothetical protein